MLDQHLLNNLNNFIRPSTGMRANIARWFSQHTVSFYICFIMAGAILPISLPFLLWFNWPKMGTVGKIAGVVHSIGLLAVFGPYLFPALAILPLIGVLAWFSSAVYMWYTTRKIVETVNSVITNPVVLDEVQEAIRNAEYFQTLVRQLFADQLSNHSNLNSPHRNVPLANTVKDIDERLDNLSAVDLNAVATIPEYFEQRLTKEAFEQFKEKRQEIFTCPILMEVPIFPVRGINKTTKKDIGGSEAYDKGSLKQWWMISSNFPLNREIFNADTHELVSGFTTEQFSRYDKLKEAYIKIINQTSNTHCKVIKDLNKNTEDKGISIQKEKTDGYYKMPHGSPILRQEDNKIKSGDIPLPDDLPPPETLQQHGCH